MPEYVYENLNSEFRFTIYEERLDELVKKHTAFEDWADLLSSTKAGYTPTLRADEDPNMLFVALALQHHYDQRNEATGARKKVYVIYPKLHSDIRGKMLRPHHEIEHYLLNDSQDKYVQEAK